MCLAIPAKVIKIDELNAQIELGGLIRQASIMLVPDINIGDYVLLHAGFAIQKIDEQEATETLSLLSQLTIDDNQ